MWYLLRYCELPTCVYAYIFECVGTRVCGCMGRLEIDMGCLPWSFSTLSIEPCSLAQPQSNQSGFLGCFRDAISTSHAGITDDPRNPPRFYIGAGVNSVPYACTFGCWTISPAPNRPSSEVVLLSYGLITLLSAWRMVSGQSYPNMWIHIQFWAFPKPLCHDSYSSVPYKISCAHKNAQSL